MSTPAPTIPASPVLGPSVTPKVIESYLRAVPPVDEVGAAERAGALATRSVKAGVQAGRPRPGDPDV